MEKNEKRALRDRYKPMAPKFSSVKANVGAAPSSSGGQAPVSSAVINPYASSSTANPAADEPTAPARRSRKIHFAPQGKYIQEGDQLRNEAKMEALKQRIAAASKKAGLDSEFDTLERSLKVSTECLLHAAWAELMFSDNHLQMSSGGIRQSYPMGPLTMMLKKQSSGSRLRQTPWLRI